LERLRAVTVPLVLYESPHRITRLLEELGAVMPEREVVLARELTKRFEEILRGKPTELLRVAQARHLRGEFVVLLGPGDEGRGEL
jgi:16S rRNA (cytidine1402-2'-O)-methyltransferase